MKNGPLILCFDIGSSACKGALIDADGHVTADHRESYSLLYDGGGFQVEQDPEILWEGVCRTVAALLSDRKRAERVAALSLSAQMCSHMLLDDRDRPLTRFLSWADRRAEAESRELAETFSPARLASELGASLPPSPAWPLPRLKWWKEREPQLLGRARRLVQPKDWILWRLCGAWFSDLSSLRGLAHQETGQISPILAAWAGFNPSLIPKVAAPDTVAGGLAAPLARQWGLPKGAPVVVGWNDLAAAVLGCGALSDAVGFDITGTSEHLGIALSGPRLTPSPCSMAEIPLGPSHRLRYGVTSSSGRVVDWYWGLFRGRPITAEGYRELEREVTSVPGGAEGLLFLPCLDGERAPWFNAQARGGFHGVGLQHRQAHFSRAVLEGVALTLRSIQQRLGAETTEFRVLGGGSAMAAWNQIKADILQTPYVTLEYSEAGCMGAAMLGTCALGWHTSLAEAGRKMARRGRTFEPERTQAAWRQEQHSRFERLYDALEPFFPVAEETRNN